MYTDGDGDIHVVGLLENGSGQTIHFAEIEANFLNAGGSTVASEDGITYVISIRPGADAPFEVVLNDPPGGIVDYEVSPGPYETIPFLSAVNINEAVTSFDGSQVTGTLQNSSGTDYSEVVVWAVIFDANGDVIRVGVADADPTNLDSGDSGTFTVFFDDPAPSAASARAWADGIGF